MLINRDRNNLKTNFKLIIFLFFIMCVLIYGQSKPDSIATSNTDNILESILKSVTTLITGIYGIIIVIGAIIFLVITKGKTVLDLFSKLKQTNKKLDKALFYDNHDTIVEYLKSDNIDLYKTAYTYITTHNEFPQKIVKTLTGIILGQSPFNKRRWMTESEKIIASQHLCYIIKKNCKKLKQTNCDSLCNIEERLKNGD